MTTAVARRGTTNGNQRGNTEDRRRRREYLIQAYRANRTLMVIVWPDGTQTEPEPYVVSREHLLKHHGVADVIEFPACRCYRCGRLLTVDTVTVDRIVPGCMGGTYRRNNIRPACGGCNSETGGALASRKNRGARTTTPATPPTEGASR